MPPIRDGVTGIYGKKAVCEMTVTAGSAGVAWRSRSAFFPRESGVLFPKVDPAKAQPALCNVCVVRLFGTVGGVD